LIFHRISSPAAGSRCNSVARANPEPGFVFLAKIFFPVPDFRRRPRFPRQCCRPGPDLKFAVTASKSENSAMIFRLQGSCAETSFSRAMLHARRFPSSTEICIARCALLALRELRFSSPLPSLSFFVLEFGSSLAVGSPIAWIHSGI
jgi:hypothetical protein